MKRMDVQMTSADKFMTPYEMFPRYRKPQESVGWHFFDFYNVASQIVVMLNRIPLMYGNKSSTKADCYLMGSALYGTSFHTSDMDMAISWHHQATVEDFELWLEHAVSMLSRFAVVERTKPYHVKNSYVARFKLGWQSNPFLSKYKRYLPTKIDIQFRPEYEILIQNLLGIASAQKMTYELARSIFNMKGKFELKLKKKLIDPHVSYAYKDLIYGGTMSEAMIALKTILDVNESF
jgi:hypothetical protein